jgi:hypothetical protein
MKGGLMNNKLNIYLSGATKQVEEGFQSWRTRCKTLSKNGYYTKLNFIDPISHFNYTTKQPKTDKECLDLFMWQIRNCDILLLCLDHSADSCGSCMEVEHAFCNNIPIIAFGDKPGTWYNWAETRSTAILESLDLAIDYIYDNYVKVVC